jgi:indole-3-glycerol phosphate synthase
MHNKLDEIIKNKSEEIEKSKLVVSQEELKKKLSTVKNRRNFLKSISNKDSVNIIAEIKKASPSKGLLKKDFDPAGIAKLYNDAGACAISVLTEKKYFMGEMGHIKAVKNESGLPVLRKDFIMDVYQVYESLVHGADAILLIASIVNKEKLDELLKSASSLGIDCLVEVHSEEDLAKTLESQAKIIGINNRNLKDFSINKHFAMNIIGKIPGDRVIVIESGLEGRNDILEYKKAGASAFLIGETLMKSEDVQSKLKELMGV